MKEEGYSWLTLKTLAMNRNDYGSRLYSETKVCPRCGKTKLLVQFGADSRSESGLDRYCKDCHNTYAKKKYWEYNESEAHAYTRTKHDLQKKNYPKKPSEEDL